MNYTRVFCLVTFCVFQYGALQSEPIKQQLERLQYPGGAYWEPDPRTRNVYFRWTKSITCEKRAVFELTQNDIDPYGWTNKMGTPKAPMFKLEQFAATYKIHPMPKLNQIVEVADRIAREIINNPELAQFVEDLKIVNGLFDPNNPLEQQQLFDSGYLGTIIVVYPCPNHAQKVLWHLDSLLGAHYEGLQLKDFNQKNVDKVKYYGQITNQYFNDKSYIPPRFSIAAKSRDGQRTSSLLYYAQGHGQEKGHFAVFNDQEKQFLAPSYVLWFDPASNGALLYPDYFGDVRDFHLYLNGSSHVSTMPDVAPATGTTAPSFSKNPDVDYGIILEWLNKFGHLVKAREETPTSTIFDNHIFPQWEKLIRFLIDNRRDWIKIDDLEKAMLLMKEQKRMTPDEVATFSTIQQKSATMRTTTAKVMDHQDRQFEKDLEIFQELILNNIDGARKHYNNMQRQYVDRKYTAILMDIGAVFSD